MMLMVQGRIFVPSTIIKTHYTSWTMYPHNIRFYVASIFITKTVEFKFSIFWEPILGNKTYVIHLEILLKYEGKRNVQIIWHSVESFSHKMNDTFSFCTIWSKKYFLHHALYMILPIWWLYLSHVTTNLFDPYQPWIVWWCWFFSRELLS